MADTAESLIDNYFYGKSTFPQLVDKFSKLPMSTPRSLRDGRTWADVYREAEEGDDNDIPAALRRASSAGQITPAETEQLLSIYRKRVPA